MIITKPPLTTFQTDFAQYGKVGFHCTSIMATQRIEANGLLPDKVFPASIHNQLTTLGKHYGIYTSGYEEWLNMRSVSFGMNANVAIAQMNNGHVGGQGLFQMENVLNAILPVGTAQEIAFAQENLTKIATIRASQPVIYAVELTPLGNRVVTDLMNVAHVYFNPAVPLPTMSDILPSYIIERLNF